ncbi:hypothetical protein [Hyphomicrobium sp. ghe19]|uniref:hypothetical protein n=1 Tax=Hyphomicrobium sp. ghe19 TaxID=2682968 RepID=UPI001366AC9F|nr:hypothetical protein HYPP_01529 [Hyphomicrobium sp. ghe19]
MANYFAPLAAPQIRNALVDFSPVNNALDGWRAQGNADRQFGLEQKASQRADESLGLQKQTTAAQLKNSGLEYEQNLAKAYGGWAQTIAGNPDPTARATMAKAMFDSHPEFGSALTKHGIDPNDTDNALKFITSEAQGYQNPQDVRLRNAQIAGAEGENAMRGKQFTTVGRDVYGQPTYGVVDLTKPNGGLPQQQAATGQPLQPTPQGASGEDYLKTLPKPMADQVKAIAEGRIPIPGGFALKTPYWQQMMTHISQYDPTFDAVNYNARAKTRNDFTSGKSAQNITSFNTAIGHLDELDHAIDGLDNSDYTAVNAATNATSGVNADRAKRLAAFNTARNAVVEELTRAFKGTGGSLTEVQEWEKLIDPKASPAALKQTVKTAVNLLASRIDSVGEQYSKGMGTTADPVKLLSSKAQKTWKKWNPDAEPEQPAASGAPRATVPQPGEVRDGFRFKGGNPGDRNSWEPVQ